MHLKDFSSADRLTSAALQSASDKLLQEKARLEERLSVVQHAIVRDLTYSVSTAAATCGAALHFKEQCGAAISRWDDVENRVRLVAGELGPLAQQALAVESARSYLETVLEVELLVGEVDAEVRAIQAVRDWSSQGVLDQIEHALLTCGQLSRLLLRSNDHSWRRLLAVSQEHLDRALGVLWPPLLAEYRRHLAQTSWPPPLTAAAAAAQQASLVERGDVADASGFRHAFKLLRMAQEVQEQLHGDVQPLRGVHELASAFWPKLSGHFAKWVVERCPDRAFTAALMLVQRHAPPLEASLQPLCSGGDTYHSVRADFAWAVAGIVAGWMRAELVPPLMNMCAGDPASCVGADAVSPASASVSTAQQRLLEAVEEAQRFDTALAQVAGDASIDQEEEFALAHARRLGLIAGAGPDQRSTAARSSLSPVTTRQRAAPVTCLPVFSEQDEWLALWARAELAAAREGMHAALAAKQAWAVDGLADEVTGDDGGATDDLALTSARLLQGRVGDMAGVPRGLAAREFKPPHGARALMAAMWRASERCWRLAAAGDGVTSTDHHLNGKGASCHGNVRRAHVLLRSVVAVLAQDYCAVLSQRCAEVEATTSLGDADAADNATGGALARVGACVAAANFCEHELSSMQEDVRFGVLALQGREADNLPAVTSAASMSERPLAIAGLALGLLSQAGGGEPCPREEARAAPVGVFGNEVDGFRQLKSLWIDKLVAALLRGLRVRLAPYCKQRLRQLQGERDAGEEEPFGGKGSGGHVYDHHDGMHGAVVTDQGEGGCGDAVKADLQQLASGALADIHPSLAQGLVALRSQLGVLHAAMDASTFPLLWRALARGVDAFLYKEAIAGKDAQVAPERHTWASALVLAGEVEAVFSVFRPYHPSPRAVLKLLRAFDTQALAAAVETLS
eukprot:jgi/Mesvir1/16142/Mv08416-RA.1